MTGREQPPEESELVRRWLEDHDVDPNPKAAKIAEVAHETLRAHGRRTKIDSIKLWGSLGFVSVRAHLHTVRLELFTPRKTARRSRIDPTQEVLLLANRDLSRPRARIYPPTHDFDVAAVRLERPRGEVARTGVELDSDDFNNETHLDEVLGYVEYIQKDSDFWARG